MDGDWEGGHGMGQHNVLPSGKDEEGRSSCVWEVFGLECGRCDHEGNCSSRATPRLETGAWRKSLGLSEKGQI